MVEQQNPNYSNIYTYIVSSNNMNRECGESLNKLTGLTLHGKSIESHPYNDSNHLAPIRIMNITFHLHGHHWNFNDHSRQDFYGQKHLHIFGQLFALIFVVFYHDFGFGAIFPIEWFVFCPNQFSKECELL